MNMDRFISKMFLRGDSVILVLRNPLATAAGKWRGPTLTMDICLQCDKCTSFLSVVSKFLTLLLNKYYNMIFEKPKFDYVYKSLLIDITVIVKWYPSITFETITCCIWHVICMMKPEQYNLNTDMNSRVRSPGVLTCFVRTSSLYVL